MNEINYLAVGVAAFTSFVIGSVWYAVFSNTMKKLSSGAATMGKLPPWMIASELLRSLVLSFTLALLLSFTGMFGIMNALQLGLLLWVGFPVVLLSGSVMWEKVPAKLAALHAGDWLLKLLILTGIIGIWR